MLPLVATKVGSVTNVGVGGPCEIIRAGSTCVAEPLIQASSVIWPEMFRPAGLLRLTHPLELESVGTAWLAGSKPSVTGPGTLLVVWTKTPPAPRSPREPLLPAG